MNISTLFKDDIIDIVTRIIFEVPNNTNTSKANALSIIKNVLNNDLLMLTNITIKEDPLENLNLDMGISNTSLQKAGKIIDTLLSDNTIDSKAFQDISDIINYIGLQSVKCKYRQLSMFNTKFTKFNVSAIKTPSSDFVQTTHFTGNSSSIIIPSSAILEYLGNFTTPLVNVFAEIATDIHRPENATYNISSNILRVAILNGTEEIPVKNLSIPITFSFSNISTNNNPTCRFFNATKALYSKYGLSLLNYTSGKVSCTTSHLSDFAIFIEVQISFSEKIYNRTSIQYNNNINRHMGSLVYIFINLQSFHIWKNQRW